MAAVALVLTLATNATAPNATAPPSPDTAGGRAGLGPGGERGVGGGGGWGWSMHGVGGWMGLPALAHVAHAAAHASGLGPLGLFLALSLVRGAAAACAALCVCGASCAAGRRLHPRLLARVALATLDAPHPRYALPPPHPTPRHAAHVPRRSMARSRAGPAVQDMRHAPALQPPPPPLPVASARECGRAGWVRGR
jgi:hypothetical protein